MKQFLLGLFMSVVFFPLVTSAQLTNGGTDAYFGVDGDTRNNYVKYGTTSGLIPTDDWFSGISSGKNVIDTSNAAVYSALLQANGNIGFSKRMSVPLYTKMNGKLWLDAVYGRDYVATAPLTDSTVFSIASKNGDNPSNWVGGSSNVPDKTDLLDVYAHMRRDGTTVHDSLWFFTGVSTVGTSGSRYFDIELYKKDFSYNSISGAFSTAGTEAGHTEWKFDASGNITQTGDMIVAVNFTPGSAPVVDLRIWVSQSTYTSVIPAYFNFGPNFDGATPAYGYASILSKAGATNFGSGISNFSATPANDTTYATPWGTEQTTKVWGQQYLSLQLVEVGLNLTRIGVDPALYTAVGLSPCESMFSEIFFKSRSSNSFVSNMQDFVAPLTFLREPVMDYSLQPDTLRCNKSAGAITITNNSTNGYYVWHTTNGNITGANTDSSQISLNKPGTYIVDASAIIGCPVTRRDTVVIGLDTFPPVASIMATVGSNFSYLQLFGGDVAASSYLTPFGGSQGLLWDWSGPVAFTSTIQNPVKDTAWGTYQLIVTEKRNGCKDTAYRTLNYFDFAVLASYYFQLSASYNNSIVKLQWLQRDPGNINYVEVQKSIDGSTFVSIGNPDVSKINNTTSVFNDDNPNQGNNYYRIKFVTKTGQTYFSNIALINILQTNQKYRFVPSLSGDQVSLIANADNNYKATVVVYNVVGAILKIQNINMYNGENRFTIYTNKENKSAVKICSLFINGKVVYSQKFLF